MSGEAPDVRSLFMRHLLIVMTLATGLLASPAASAVQPYAEVGVGLPELTKIRVGAHLHPRLSVEAYGGSVILNWLVGAGVTGYVLGQARERLPPRHALGLQGTVAFNPTLRPLRVRSGGDVIGSAFLGQAGYAYTADSGFLFRVWLGGIVALEQRIGGGPMLSLGVGWIFGARR